MQQPTAIDSIAGTAGKDALTPYEEAWKARSKVKKERAAPKGKPRARAGAASSSGAGSSSAAKRPRSSGGSSPAAAPPRKSGKATAATSRANHVGGNKTVASSRGKARAVVQQHDVSEEEEEAELVD